MRLRVQAAEGRIEGPAGINAAGNDGVEREDCSDDIYTSSVDSVSETPGRAHRSSSAQGNFPAWPESKAPERKTPSRSRESKTACCMSPVVPARPAARSNESASEPPLSRR